MTPTVTNRQIAAGLAYFLAIMAGGFAAIHVLATMLALAIGA